MPQADVRRLVGTVDETVKRCIRDGHTAFAVPTFRRTLAATLNVSETSCPLDHAIAAGERNGAILPDDRRWRPPGAATLEDTVKTRLRAMVESNVLTSVHIPGRTVCAGSSNAMSIRSGHSIPSSGKLSFGP